MLNNMHARQFILVFLTGISIVMVAAYLVYTYYSFTESDVTPDVVILREDGGYDPNYLVIPLNTKVIWKNNSAKHHWPASDLHPTHGLYPEFDSLRPISPLEDWEFVFDKVGEWPFHDHLQANINGRIIVE